MRSRRQRREARADEVRTVWAVCAALLDYPTPELIDSLDAIESLAPDHAGLVALIEHLRSGDLIDLQADYVATFDHTRKCALHLTYFAYGDTRRRGLALLEFKQAYRAAGVEWDEDTGELPDHLCAVLQLGATVDLQAGLRLLLDHRAGIEMLRLALTGWRRDDGGTGSPWAGAVLAVCETLPELRGDEAEAVRRLVEQGPPAEAVGLDGYAADPALAGRPTLISTASIPVGAPR